jgi:glycosyltransferase involved in cell wall biosynthesis
MTKPTIDETVLNEARRRPDETTDAKPLVSVLIVNYNYATYLPAAIDSVLKQTYHNFELIICDDGSTDGSINVIEDYAAREPDRIRMILKENGGVASALNAAYAASRGDVLCFLDADDIFAPRKLELVVKTFSANREVGLVSNRLIKVDDKGRMSGLIPQFGRLDKGWIREDLLRSGGHWSFAPTSGISLRRDCAEDVFPIPESSFRSEADVFINTQAPMKWAIDVVPQPVTYYRLHSRNLTASETITPQYAARIIKGLERMSDALNEAARKEGVTTGADVGNNPVFNEMRFVRDYLERTGWRTLTRDLKAYWRSAFRARTGDRAKLRLKAPVLSIVAVLPRALGKRVLQSIFLPTRLRRAIAGIILRRAHQREN